MALYFAHPVILCITITVQSGLQSPILDQRSTRSKNDNISLTTKPVQTRGFESSRPITEPQEVTATDATQEAYYNMSHFTNYEIVGQWSRLCKVTKKTEELNVFTINCTVPVNSNLNFVKFRQFTSKLLSEISIDLFVVCVGGDISFPWPFKAGKLRRIHVKNCLIKDFRTEFHRKDIDDITDVTRYFVMENNTILMTTTELYASLSTVNTSLTRSAECGPENAIAITRRNTAIQIVDTGNFKEPNIVFEHSRHFNIQRRVCMYANVETFEESGTYYLESNEINEIAYTDEAPNLKVLNFSSCGMFDTLYKFKHWRSRFPLLKYLDFSHNLIQAIPEITDYGDTKTDPSVGIIDLRNNNISVITKDMINSFSKHKFVKIDIRENSYHCDCRIIEVMKYLELQDMPAHYDYLKSLKCSSPVSVYGKLIASISMDELKCSKETVLNITSLS